MVTVQHPHLGEQTVLGPPWRFPAIESEPDRPGPLLGEHTAEVLRDLLGFNTEEIEQLVQRGVLV